MLYVYIYIYIYIYGFVQQLSLIVFADFNDEIQFRCILQAPDRPDCIRGWWIMGVRLLRGLPSFRNDVFEAAFLWFMS